jgi:hypothetical protein
MSSIQFQFFQIYLDPFERRIIKIKVKLSLCLTKHHAMKMYWDGGIAPHIINLGSRRR